MTWYRAVVAEGYRYLVSAVNNFDHGGIRVMEPAGVIRVCLANQVFARSQPTPSRTAAAIGALLLRTAVRPVVVHRSQAERPAGQRRLAGT